MSMIDSQLEDQSNPVLKLILAPMNPAPQNSPPMKCVREADLPPEFQLRHMQLARILFPLFTLLLGLAVLYIVYSISQNLSVSTLSLQTIEDVLLLYLWIITVTVSGFFCFLLLSLLVWKESWLLETHRVTYEGLFRRRKIEFAAIDTVTWWPWNRMIILYGDQQRIPLFLDSLSYPLRLRVIELIRTECATADHKNWNNFSRQLYLPLRQKLSRSC